MPNPSLVYSRRVRTTPFEPRVLEHGVQAFTVYNHMTLASSFRSPREDYAHLCEHVQIWDVSCERQVEVAGPDALALVELVTPRDISRCEVGQCMYAPLVDENGGIVNDPIVLRLDEQRFWLSIADSDVLLWLKGIAVGRGMDVTVFEPDVSPLAVQGPRADDVMEAVLGPEVRDIGFFRFIECEIAETPVVMARSGWSGQGGFEIYLQDSAKGLDLWDCIWEVGQAFNIRVGCPNLIERLETGLLSYGSDMTLDNNPVECGLDRFYKPGKPAEHLCREALDRINREGVRRKLAYVMLPGEAIASPRSVYRVLDGKGQEAGMVTSLAWSPRYEANLAFATVDAACAEAGTVLSIETSEGVRQGTVKERGWR